MLAHFGRSAKCTRWTFLATLLVCDSHLLGVRCNCFAVSAVKRATCCFCGLLFSRQVCLFICLSACLVACFVSLLVCFLRFVCCRCVMRHSWSVCFVFVVCSLLMAVRPSFLLLFAYGQGDSVGNRHVFKCSLSSVLVYINDALVSWMSCQCF